MKPLRERSALASSARGWGAAGGVPGTSRCPQPDPAGRREPPGLSPSSRGGILTWPGLRSSGRRARGRGRSAGHGAHGGGLGGGAPRQLRRSSSCRQRLCRRSARARPRHRRPGAAAAH